MKNQLSIGFLLGILILSCNTSERKKKNDIESMKSNLITYANDLAFKNNGKVTIYTIQVIKLDTIDKRNIDSNFINKEANNKTDSYLEQCKLAQLKAKQSLTLLELSQLAGSSSSIQKYKDEVLTNTKEAQLYLDSSKLTIKISDSLLRLVSKINSPDKIYRMKTFIKATFYYGKDSTNTMDTIYYSFRKDLKLYSPENSDYSIKF